MKPPRGLQQRRRDTLGRLESEADAWIASADAGVTPIYCRCRSSGMARV